jgi:hypothetical protein
MSVPALRGYSLEDRFWARVIRPEDLDACWGWSAGTQHGYGAIGEGKRVWLAHRLSWTIHYGSIPRGKCVLHHCDNRPCNNPRHFFLGTRADNMYDMWGKSRGRAGSGRPRVRRGTPHTPEHRAHLAASIRAWWARRREVAA